MTTWIKILFVFAGIVIVTGIVMLAGDRTATTNFNSGTETQVVSFSGSHIILLGLAAFCIGIYAHHREKNRTK